ncbi:MAG: aldehyde dehydrogenase family protein [Myxococcota bacterium]
MAEPELFSARGDLIDGRFVRPAGATGELRLEDPGDLGALDGAFPFSVEALESAVEAARHAHPAWRDAHPEERAAYLRRFATCIELERDRLAQLIAREVGKPLWEAATEVDAMVAKVEITLGPGLELIRERSFESGPGQRARWRAHARGVLAVLGPFNFPGHLLHGHVVPALATGNTVVVKPSEHAPATGQLYAELAQRAGFPPGVLNLVQGDGQVGARLASHPDVQGVLFTGSYAVGRRILEATLDQPFKIVALEMGGKNAVLVCADADPGQAAHAIAYGAAITTGQRCSATSRVIVERPRADELIERLVRVFGGIHIGYGLDEDVFMGPLISAAARERHARVLELAREEGAEILLEGGPVEGPRRGHYVRPSLHRVDRVSRTSPYQAEEHFVPDVHVVVVEDFDEAVAALGCSDYGLAGSVFTSSRERFEHVLRESRLGLLNWNTSTVGASSNLPFGGVGRSGNDRPAGVMSTLYCTYPIASLERLDPEPLPTPPGFPRSP